MKQKCLTIITSETELMDNIYIVTPTTTGSPEIDKEIQEYFSQIERIPRQLVIKLLQLWDDKICKLREFSVPKYRLTWLN